MKEGQEGEDGSVPFHSIVLSFHCVLGIHTLMVQHKCVKTKISQHSPACHVSEVTLHVTAGVML